MTAKERTGERSLLYSRWHREENTRKYLTPRQAWSLGYIDIDSCEYCRHCSTPLALIETQVSDGPPKSARVTGRLAELARIPAYSVSIVSGDADEIARFRVQQIEPHEAHVQDMLPSVYAYWLWSLRKRHNCEGTRTSNGGGPVE